ncbi:peptidase M23 [Mobiluncus mulieris]|uniref:Peptidase M23 n=1 Tax=Mobiluncus mulieris TaxID=2052 RepID=A0ABD4TZT0_9ACTO|nr:peptidase M23 [Mobiluncus mulieris]MCU9969737.1 peptidase M23 [Mobiluncus mulieris]MCU9974123.1 peptidase M23 [Mobiluncus mulieris]MCV0010262.1 peptidase M23 [Mobiluncus mulieris]NMW75902.1 peptidase M23 [Mobiluncus mulieris]NMX02067.1 peptidase M23 [Mobiluncus mulieris]
MPAPGDGRNPGVAPHEPARIPPATATGVAPHEAARIPPATATGVAPHEPARKNTGLTGANDPITPPSWHSTCESANRGLTYKTVVGCEPGTAGRTPPATAC